jgi:hypothetical protein
MAKSVEHRRRSALLLVSSLLLIGAAVVVLLSRDGDTGTPASTTMCTIPDVTNQVVGTYMNRCETVAPSTSVDHGPSIPSTVYITTSLP